MIPSNLILAILLRLPVCYGEEQNIDQLEIISNAIGTNSNTNVDAAALITIGTFESSWCEKVGSGELLGGSGIGYWQIEPGSNRIKPFAGLNLDDITHAAGEALWIWHHSYQCGSSINSRFIAYAGVKKCAKWSGASRRARFFYWALGELNK